MNATVEQLAPVEQPATTTWVVAALYQFKEVARSCRSSTTLIRFGKFNQPLRYSYCGR